MRSVAYSNQLEALTKTPKFVETYVGRLDGGGEGGGRQLVAIAFHTAWNQLIVAHRLYTIHRFQIMDMLPTLLNRYDIDNHDPQSIAFGIVDSNGPQVWSFSRSSGDM